MCVDMWQWTYTLRVACSRCDLWRWTGTLCATRTLCVTCTLCYTRRWICKLRVISTLCIIEREICGTFVCMYMRDMTQLYVCIQVWCCMVWSCAEKYTVCYQERNLWYICEYVHERYDTIACVHTTLVLYGIVTCRVIHMVTVCAYM